MHVRLRRSDAGRGARENRGASQLSRNDRKPPEPAWARRPTDTHYNSPARAHLSRCRLTRVEPVEKHCVRKGSPLPDVPLIDRVPGVAATALPLIRPRYCPSLPSGDPRPGYWRQRSRGVQAVSPCTRPTASWGNATLPQRNSSHGLAARSDMGMLADRPRTRLCCDFRSAVATLNRGKPLPRSSASRDCHRTRGPPDLRIGACGIAPSVPRIAPLSVASWSPGRRGAADPPAFCQVLPFLLSTPLSNQNPPCSGSG